MVIDTYNHTQTHCMLESWHIQHLQSPLNRERGTLAGLYAALPDLARHPSGILPLLCCCYCWSSHFPPLIAVWCFLLHCTRLCPIVMLILSSPPTLFLLFNLGYAMLLAKLACFLTCCTGMPHLTTSLSDCHIVFLHACLKVSIILCVCLCVNYSL